MLNRHNSVAFIFSHLCLSSAEPDSGKPSIFGSERSFRGLSLHLAIVMVFIEGVKDDDEAGLATADWGVAGFSGVCGMDPCEDFSVSGNEGYLN